MKVTECLNTEHGVFLTQLDVLERMLNDEAPPVLARSGPCAWRPETAVPPSGVAKAPPGVPSRSSDDQPIASWTPRARERTLARNGESTAVLERQGARHRHGLSGEDSPCRQRQQRESRRWHAVIHRRGRW